MPIDCLVLSGCGDRSIAFPGILDYFYQKNLLIHVKAFCGVSAGSPISLYLAMGYSPLSGIEKLKNVMPILQQVSKGASFIDATNLKGYISYDIVDEVIRSHVVERFGKVITMKELYDITGKELICCMLNYTTQKPIYASYKDPKFTNVLVTDAVRMSCALPFIFKPVKFRGDLIIDSWIRELLPLRYAASKFDMCLAINILHDLSFPKHDEFSMLHVLYKNATASFPEYFDHLHHKSIQIHMIFGSFDAAKLDETEIKRIYNLGYNFADKEYTKYNREVENIHKRYMLEHKKYKISRMKMQYEQNNVKKGTL